MSDGRNRNSNRYGNSGTRGASSQRPRQDGNRGGRDRRDYDDRRRMSKSQRRKQRRNRIVVTIIVIVLVVAIVLTTVLAVTGTFSDNTASATTAASENNLVTETNADGETVTGDVSESVNEVTFIAVGDIIGHDTILEISETETGYDFTPLFAKLKSDIQTTDVAVANAETPFGGPDVGPYIGYPSFNTPDEMGLAIMDAGFNVVQLASNHSMDSGVEGLLHEMEFWNQYKDRVTTVGVNESEEAKNTITTKEVNGITFAFLNYTYGLNGYELPDEYSYMLTLLTSENQDFIVSQIQQADQIADVVVVLPHWGTEYVVGTPTDEQVEWAQVFTAAGADLIIGTHPHVVENIEWIESNGNKALCYYSLGNFVSNQQGTDTVLGGMAYLKIKKDGDTVYIDEESASVIPLVTHNDKTGEKTVIQTYYLADYTDELASVHDTKLNSEDSADWEFSVSLLNQKAEYAFGSEWIRDRIN